MKLSSPPGDPPTCIPYSQNTHAVFYVGILYKYSTMTIPACPHITLAELS